MILSCDCLPQELKREKLLVERLMRQCQQERRIATQLMHIRKEKDSIRNNRSHCSSTVKGVTAVFKCISRSPLQDLPSETV